MNKYAVLAVISILVISVFGLFQIKYSVQYLHKDVEEMKRQLIEEKNSIHTLKAEWAFLNNPRRLKILVKRYLTMQEIKMSQIQNFNYMLSASNNNIKNVKHEYKKKHKWNFKDKNIKFNNQPVAVEKDSDQEIEIGNEE